VAVHRSPRPTARERSWGCVGQIGEQTFDIGRTAALVAGFPETVTGVTVDRQCGSSQQAVHFAAAGLIAGHYDIVVAGGVESMSRIPMGMTSSVGGSPMDATGWMDRYGPGIPNQGLGAQMIADNWGLSPTRMD
jgi:acetyl-CoA acyltransferase